MKTSKRRLDFHRPLMLEDGTPLTNVRDFGDEFTADAPTASDNKVGRVFRADGTSPYKTGNAIYADISAGTNSLPENATERNKYPMADGLLDYFPNALAEVSRVSFIGNQQHNPGEPMHWARGKSTDHRNKIIRHLIDAGKKDEKGVRHSAYVAWRALANLQEELEREEGAPLSRGSHPPEEK